MVTAQQLRSLMKDLGESRALSVSAKRAGMSENTGRKYRRQGGATAKKPRTYRTRRDPFERVWPEVEKLLEEAPGLEALSVFEVLRTRQDVTYSDGQLRTLQRPAAFASTYPELDALNIMGDHPTERGARLRLYRRRFCRRRPGGLDAPGARLPR